MTDTIPLKLADSVLESLKEQTSKTVDYFTFKHLTVIAKVCSVYDGDSCKIIFHYKGDFVKCTVRMYGYDTPEMRAKDQAVKDRAYEARDFLRKTIINKLVIADLDKFDKYGRLLAKLYVFNESNCEAGDCINDLMVTEGYGVDYFGGTKTRIVKKTNMLKTIK